MAVAGGKTCTVNGGSGVFSYSKNSNFQVHLLVIFILQISFFFLMFFLFLFFNETEEVYYFTEKLMVGIVILSYLSIVILVIRSTF